MRLIERLSSICVFVDEILLYMAQVSHNYLQQNVASIYSLQIAN